MSEEMFTIVVSAVVAVITLTAAVGGMFAWFHRLFKADLLASKVSINERFDAVDARFDRVDDEFVMVRTEMKEEFAAVRSEMKDEFTAVRSEMKDEFTAVRAEAKEEFTSVRTELKELSSNVASLNVTVARLEGPQTRFLYPAQAD